MYLRFKTSFTNEYQENRFGVFQAASFLLRSDTICKYDQQRLEEVWHWFRFNLSEPNVFKQKKRDINILCWYKPTACEHLQRMYEMIDILEAYNMSVYKVRCKKPGYILYEDDEQVAVLPFTRLLHQVR